MIDNPIVIFDNDNVEKMISYWLEIDGDYTNTYLEIILGKLGFGFDDKVYVYGYTKNCDLLFRVNDYEEYRINMSSKDNIPVVSFIKDEVSDEYLCIVDKYGRFEVELKLLGYKDNEFMVEEKEEIKEDVSKVNDVQVIEDEEEKHLDPFEEMSSSRGYLNYRVVNGLYVIELNFSKYELYYGILNRQKVFEYLSTLSFPVSIFDVYKKICEIAQITDINKFSLFDLRILKWTLNEELGGDYEITDLITLSDGELIELMVTRNGKQIYSNQEGNWSCDMDKSLVEFTTIKNYNSISFNTKVKFKNEDIIDEEVANEDVMNAKIEVAKVKKLAKDTFTKKK